MKNIFHIRRLKAVQKAYMTQSERREYLIKYLLKEDRKIFRQKMPSDKEGQENLLRSLMNVRMPKPVSSDERMYIWQGDITTLKCMR